MGERPDRVTWLWWLWPLGPPSAAWPQIVPNIVASLIWAVPGVLAHLHTRRNLRRLHAKHDDLNRRIRGDVTERTHSA